MKWYGSQNKNEKYKFQALRRYHSPIMLSLENEKATLLICIGLFLHLIFLFFLEIKHKMLLPPICDYMLVKTIHNMT